MTSLSSAAGSDRSRSSSFQLTPGYFRYIVWDLSGSIAYSNHATINLKLGIRSFFQE